MSCFPDTFQFPHAWRPYQARVLGAFEEHLHDRHFHVAAAPGAGKTVLGLEAMRRLQQPALILAPTIAIRDQWRRRLCETFLGGQAPTAVPWLSDDLATPATVTLSTYQGLHAAVKRLGNEALHQRLLAAGLKTLVLDEAHHLRQHWWQCLIDLKQALREPWVIALTATPPFDVPQLEWNRYVNLCGPLDAEVSVPELVLAGNLCPHQDYVYFTTPAADEAETLQSFEQSVRALMHDLLLQPELPALLAAHPLVTAPEQHIDTLVQRGDYVLAIALFLQDTAAEHARPLLHALGLETLSLPRFSVDWAEILLNGLLQDRDEHVDCESVYVIELTRRLRTFAAIEHRQIYLRAPPRLLRLLERSRSKCAGVAAIIEQESRADPVGLRAVVLCDHIREDDLPEPGDSNTHDFKRVGVVPVFELIRRLQLPDARLGVLTGSLIIVPVAALPMLQQICGELGDASHHSEPLWHAPSLHRVVASASQGGVLLSALTRLFERGDINVLIGTAALLGEGWDAPAISTLILASSVRTSMRSNQMRGRAIRVQPGNPDKAANIWHLACLPPPGDASSDSQPGGPDMAALRARFRSFAGVSVAPDESGLWSIETGIDRLRLDAVALVAGDAERLNAAVCAAARDRIAMCSHWRAALRPQAKTPPRMLMETRVPLRRLAAATRFRHGIQLERFFLVRWFRSQLLRRKLDRLGNALLDALRATAQIRSADARLLVSLGEREVRCRLQGGNTHEETLFAECMRQLFAEPTNARYLVQQSGRSLTMPAALDANRQSAEQLRRAFARRVGKTTLIYTRSAGGRRALLKAREQWLAARFEDGCESRLLWA